MLESVLTLSARFAYFALHAEELRIGFEGMPDLVYPAYTHVSLAAESRARLQGRTSLLSLGGLCEFSAFGRPSP